MDGASPIIGFDAAFNELISKGIESDRQFDSRYIDAAQALVKLHQALDAAQETFFGKELSKQGIAEFALAVQDAVREVNKEFVKHRGSWYGEGNPLVDFVKVFLKILDTLICRCRPRKVEDRGL